MYQLLVEKYTKQDHWSIKIEIDLFQSILINQLIMLVNFSIDSKNWENWENYDGFAVGNQ